MTEREEKIIKKGEKKEEKKPSLWQRMKKPLAAGLLGASLLFSPAKKADAIYLRANPPPYIASEVENDKLLKKGLKILDNYWYGDGTPASLEIAKKIFESVYKKTGNPAALILDYTTDHYLAIEKKTYRESKEILLKKLQAIEERLKIYTDDARSIIEKHITLKALFYAAHGLYFNKEGYREYRKEKEIDLYYEDAIKYGKELIEFEKELMTNIANSMLKEYTSKGFREISDSEKDNIKEYIKEDLKENERMYEEIQKEKRKD
ncbi:MAG: hypothetical protein QXK21_01505 [Candidatus Micrarchaeia archaeon]